MTLEQLCKDAEFFETDEWAADAIFDRELLTPLVVDAGSGRGMLSRAAEKRGYSVAQVDKTDWDQHGFDRYESNEGTVFMDFLQTSLLHFGLKQYNRELSVITNPPFSLADQFVVHSLEVLKARKVLCFQRLAWRESEDRREFWEKYPPQRTYVCGSRATCWRGDLLDPAKRKKPDGTDMSNAPTAHAWFVFEPGQPLGGMGAIYKPEKVKLKGLLT